MFFLLCYLITFPATPQLIREINYPEVEHYVEKWNAKWITCEGIPEADYAIVMFRRVFSLTNRPDSFIIHVSADNRYKLYVNGKLAVMGPQGSDWRHWRYETVDIAPYLQTGNNVIAAEVANWGPDRFFGIMSIRTAFMLQGLTQKESIVNTIANSEWKVQKNESYYPLAPNWIFGVGITGGFYASNPGDSLQVSQFPQDWESLSFDDSKWKNAKWIWNISNERDGGFFWLMKPRNTPQVEQKVERFREIARSNGLDIPAEFIYGKKELIVPPHSDVTILYDYKTMTIGFPELILSGGKNSMVTIHYAENLLNHDLTKGDRSDVAGKHIRGLRDVIIPDGRNNFHFSPTWYRAFRFVQINIKTNDNPLTIHDYYHVETKAPMIRRATFECNNDDYLKIDEICWRTAAICTQDNLMSDAYYEQMMYVGDSRIHALVNLYMTGNDIWLRNAIEQFNYSRMPDGNITSCYPLKSTFVHPTFSLVWIDILYDFMMHCNNPDFIRNYIQNVRSTLAWFDHNMLENGMVGKPVGSYFVDWYSDPLFAGKGVYPGSEDGNSAVVTLHYAATLLRAAEIFDYLGVSGEASIFRLKAEKVKNAVIKNCWDENKKLFAENPDKIFFDERSNIMAITAHVFNETKQKELFIRSINNKEISKSSYYFRNNHFNEMRRLGLGNHIDNVLDIWKDLLTLNLTTTPERIARQRSDTHPWSASPSIAFIKVIAGITPAEPGYKSVSIEPSFGTLDVIKASYPHYLGDIKVDFKRIGNNGVEGSIELPEGLTGTFKFNKKVIVLKEGEQNIKFNE